MQAGEEESKWDARQRVKCEAESERLLLLLLNPFNVAEGRALCRRYIWVLPLSYDSLVLLAEYPVAEAPGRWCST